MYESHKTRNVTWRTFYVIMANIHKLALLGVFMVAKFGDKLKGRYLLNVISYLSVDKATHENTHFSWRSVQLKTYGRIYKARATHPKESILSLHIGARISFLWLSPLNLRYFTQKQIFFCIEHLGLSWLISKWLQVVFVYHFQFFHDVLFLVTFFSHVFVSCLFDLITVKRCFTWKTGSIFLLNKHFKQ